MQAASFAIIAILVSQRKRVLKIYIGEQQKKYIKKAWVRLAKQGLLMTSGELLNARHLF